ncbi:MAG: cytochrome c maturation protein CcmE [Bacteroidia bacterium]|jgi:cytochrome c-type biogenesis protein CcmE|nr:cytochrome c maturation protein CcmE [Bacteroidota bacterium]MBL7916616.1 cytochrome c maturation protein CcmE [Bacteroidia bacterium]OQA11921.1 MAG: Cytochrome c-type biogenesis protein CcmE [Bacteroidetes bacterium ADurb.Bin397]MBK7969071.1 cytochrome c maturation protein CcmE [Bacteroidota bacterium]MBK8413455.1 cytochrome c maturation protein CcmE [Bacteroidota bacterium]
MKRIHIIGIVIIAVALAAIVSTISNSSTYAPFSTAMEHEGKTYHVVGQLNRDKDFIYNPEQNANLFGFYLVDVEGKEMKVLYNGTKPQDFEKSEQVVIIGKVSGDEFHAANILMKCPSKYNGNEQQQQNMIPAGT